MAYGVLIESMIQAKNIDALNRSVKAEIDVDGGNLIALTAPTKQGDDVWVASAPTLNRSVTSDLEELQESLNFFKRFIALVT